MSAFLGALELGKAVYNAFDKNKPQDQQTAAQIQQYQPDANAAAYGGHAGTPGHYEYVPNEFGIPMPVWREGTLSGTETHSRAMDRRGDQGFDEANVAYQQAQQARGMQQRAADMAFARAAGAVPSQAQMMADRQGAQLAAQQMSQSAGARGAAGMALAQQNAANATATGMANLSGQAQQNAAAERERAERAAFEMSSGMRGSDISTGNNRMGDARGWAGLSHDIRRTGMSGAMDVERLRAGQMDAARGSRDREMQREHEHDEARNAFTDKAIMRMTEDKTIKPGSGGGDDGSDERLKRNIGPLTRAAKGRY